MAAMVMAPMRAMPPITPPTMAPMLDFLEELGWGSGTGVDWKGADGPVEEGVGESGVEKPGVGVVSGVEITVVPRVERVVEDTVEGVRLATGAVVLSVSVVWAS